MLKKLSHFFFNYYHIILILSVSGVLAYSYFNRVDLPHFELRYELHNQIISKTAPSPYRYRILAPFLCEVILRGLSLVFSEKFSFLLTYAIYDSFSISFILITLFFWLRNWFTKEQSLIGVLFVAGTMTIAFQDHYFQPWSLLEPALFTTAMFAIYNKKYTLLIFLTILASLNRETALFIPLTLFFTIDIKTLLNPKNSNWGSIILLTGLFLTWAALFFGLRYFLGNSSHVETIKGLLSSNTTKRHLFYTFINVTLFFGSLGIFALLGFKYAPTFIRRTTLIVPLWLVIVAIWGVWYEVRLLMPLYPILVPLGLSFIYLREGKKTP